MKKSERNEQIHAARKLRGLQYKEIGERFGITGARARQIYISEERRLKLEAARIQRLRFASEEKQPS